MGHQTGFRDRGVRPAEEVGASVRERFWEAVWSGVSPTAAATSAGVSAAALLGAKWIEPVSPAELIHTNPRQRTWDAKRYTLLPELGWADFRATSGMVHNTPGVLLRRCADGVLRTKTHTQAKEMVMSPPEGSAPDTSDHGARYTLPGAAGPARTGCRRPEPSVRLP